MDNSKISSEDNSCVGGSMYLSFESTMSNSTAYKTVQSMSDTVSTKNADAEDVDEISQDLHTNSTLQAQDVIDFHAIQPNMVAKMNGTNGVGPSPLCAFRKNVLQECKAYSSTPTKEQLLRSVEVTRGSQVENCVDLGVHFQSPTLEDNKENAQPEVEGGTTLIESATRDKLTSPVEKKMLNVGNTEKKTEQNINVIMAETAVAAKTNEQIKDVKVEDENLDKKDSTLSGKTGIPKLSRSIPAPKIIRKSSCEPDLQTNRPSRIVTAETKKGTSLLPSGIKPKTECEISAALPKFFNKMKISNVGEEVVSTAAPDQSNANNKRRTVVGAPRGRNSMLPPAKGVKAPYGFTKRMSIMVKTTLNSPARKISRRSVLPNSKQGVGLPAKTGTSSGAVSVAAARKSVLPIGKNITAATHSTVARKSIMPPVKETGAKPKAASRKSIYPLTKQVSAEQKLHLLPTKLSIQPKTNIPTKTEIFFACSVCGCKFRVKSLLDAHKRSHEDDTSTLVKKPTASVTGTNSICTTNVCKFCDKKFALLRALHIHLMQNCPKIPPSEKRKLHFTEMNHVEKAQLPVFAHAKVNANLMTNTNANSATSNNASKILQQSQSNLSNAPMSSTESLTDKKEVTVIVKELVATFEHAQTEMAPPTTNKIKVKTAHAGVYRTPNKAIPCHLCKQSFKRVLDYTKHTMTMHPTHATSKADNVRESAPM